MEKIYCKQIPPEHQEDDLFWTTKNHELRWNNDAYVNDVIISGNKDFLGYHTKAYEKVKKIEDILYEYETTNNEKSNHCYWDSVSQLIDYYLSKENGKRYSKKEIHKWKEILDNWYNYRQEEEHKLQALQLITGKKWRTKTIRGCMQSEWQTIYVSEAITDKDIDYIEMCYFNTGTEWLVYESEKDYNEDNYSYSLYVDGYNVKTNLAERIGCKEEELVVMEFDDWKRIPTYKEI